MSVPFHRSLRRPLRRPLRDSLRGITFLALGFAASSVGWGCATTPPASPTSAAPTSFGDQVAAGRAVYARSCAGCHGASGQGDKAPRLVGLKEGALPLEPPADRKVRKTPFVTVADVAAFVVANMPPKRDGAPSASLTADQYWAILAFDLHANGIDLPSPLTPEMAPTLKIPR